MIRLLVLVTAAALLVACVATPWLYAALLELWPDPPPLFPAEPWPFRRVFNRVALAALLAGLWLGRRQLAWPLVADAWTREDARGRLRRVLAGLALTLVPGLAIFPLLVAGDAFAWSSMSAGRFAWKMAQALPAALLVSFGEEAFFRVMVLESLRRRMLVGAAIAGSSAFYALVHFLEPVRDFAGDGAAPGTGFAYLGAVLGRFGEPALWPGMLGLFAIGCLLCLAWVRRGSLALCAGMHAGWFLLAKAAVYLLDPTSESARAAGRYFVAGRPETWASLGVVLALLLVRVERAAPPRVGSAG